MISTYKSVKGACSYLYKKDYEKHFNILPYSKNGYLDSQKKYQEPERARKRIESWKAKIKLYKLNTN